MKLLLKPPALSFEELLFVEDSMEAFWAKVGHRDYYSSLLRQEATCVHFKDGRKHVKSFSPSRYILQHEMAHAIQARNHHFIYELHSFLLALYKFWLLPPWLARISEFYMEKEATEMAILMVKMMGKWTKDEQVLAKAGLLSYATTPHLKRIVEAMDWNI